MPVCGRVVAAVAALTETGADRSTPCPEWTVCQLAQHLPCTARRFHRRAAGQDYYPAHAEVLRQAWDSSVPHLRIDLTGDPWATVLSSAGRSVPQVVSSAASWSGVSSAMWCPLSMGAPRRSVLQGAQTGPVVLQHGPHRGRVVDRASVVGIVLSAHPLGVAAIPGVRVSQNGPLRFVRLRKEEPVPPGGGEPGVGSGQGLPNRDTVEHGQASHSLRRIERKTSGDVTAPVMANDREPLVPQLLHQRQHVAGHGPLGVRPVICGGDRFGGLAIAAQVWAHDRVPSSHQQRRDTMPSGMGARMAVQKHDRRTHAAASHPQPDAPPISTATGPGSR